MTKQQIAKAEKLTILVRYTVKVAGTYKGVFYKKGSVVCLVRNGEGKEYYVTLNRNKQHSCTCEGYAKWNKQCYHIEVCRDTTNARNAARKAEEKRRNAEAEIERIVAQAEADLAHEHPNKADHAPLNGNRPFSLMR